MDARRFVASSRAEWERLEELLSRVGARGLGSLSPAELRDLGLIYRKVSADLAAARTFLSGSRVVEYLNGLAVRSHNAVYVAPRRGWRSILRSVATVPPSAVRRHPGALATAVIVFVAGGLFGAVGTALDEAVAGLVLGRGFLELLRRGGYWITDFSDPLLSTMLMSHNLSVAILAFASGITGLFTVWVLFSNGAMLGSLLVLCAQYGQIERFVPFVVPHGVTEISAILLAGAGGLTTFDGWLAPGDRTRLAGLRHGAREGLWIFVAAAAGFMLAAPVEGLISASEAVPPGLRLALGVVLGLAFWSWVVLTHEPTAARGA